MVWAIGAVPSCLAPDTGVLKGRGIMDWDCLPMTKGEHGNKPTEI